jgi:AcrR family transcriptional regulator
MPKAFSETEREAIRAKLIEVGKRIINQASIRLLLVDYVAREAGISKGSFYSFHPSREDFILSVFESWETEYRGALIREVGDGGGTPRERIAVNQAEDNRVLAETFGRWAAEGLLGKGVTEAFRGLVPALFSIAMHREDFPPGSYQPAVRLIAEALAMRIASGENAAGGSS